MVNQELIARAALEGDRHLALQAMANDPLVHDLSKAAPSSTNCWSRTRPTCRSSEREWPSPPELLLLVPDRQRVRVGGRGDLERVVDGRDVLVLADRAGQLDHPARVVALQQRVEERLLDPIGAQQLADVEDDVALVGLAGG